MCFGPVSSCAGAVRSRPDHRRAPTAARGAAKGQPADIVRADAVVGQTACASSQDTGICGPGVPGLAWRTALGVAPDPRLGRLLAAMRAVRDGDPDARAAVSGDDELAELGVLFDQLATRNQALAGRLARLSAGHED